MSRKQGDDSGHAVISIPQKSAYPDIKDILKKAMTDFLDTKSFTFSPLPSTFILPEAKFCKICRGTGKLTLTECEECNGKCHVSFDNDHKSYDCECKSCDGEGEEKTIGVGGFCNICLDFGSGYESFDCIEINGVKINLKYARIPTSIENDEISNHDERLYFRSEDIQGVILGMRT